MTARTDAPQNSKRGQAGIKNGALEDANGKDSLKPTLTPAQRKKVSDTMRMLGRVGGLTVTPKARAARRKNMLKALKVRHQKAA